MGRVTLGAASQLLKVALSADEETIRINNSLRMGSPSGFCT